MRPRGAAAAEPEGPRAGQQSPWVPCCCPDLPPQVPVPPHAPAAALSPVSHPPKPQIIFEFFPRSFKVTSSLQLRVSPASLLSPGLPGKPAGHRPREGLAGAGEECDGVGWGGVREREGPSHLLIYLQMLLMMPLIHSVPLPLFSFRH